MIYVVTVVILIVNPLNLISTALQYAYVFQFRSLLSQVLKWKRHTLPAPMNGAACIQQSFFLTPKIVTYDYKRALNMNS